MTRKLQRAQKQRPQKTLNWTSSHMRQVQEDYKLPLTVSEHVYNDNTLRQPYRSSFKRTVAPRWNLRTSCVQDEVSCFQAERHEPKNDSVSMPPEGLYCSLKCLIKFYSYCVRYWTSTWGAWRTVTKYQVCVQTSSSTTAHRVLNDCTLPMADDVEATMSMRVRNDVKLYQPTTSKHEKDDVLPS